MTHSRGFDEFLDEVVDASRLDNLADAFDVLGEWRKVGQIDDPDETEVADTSPLVPDPSTDQLYSGTGGTSELDGVYPSYGNDHGDTSGQGW